MVRYYWFSSQDVFKPPGEIRSYWSAKFCICFDDSFFVDDLAYVFASEAVVHVHVGHELSGVFEDVFSVFVVGLDEDWSWEAVLCSAYLDFYEASVFGDVFGFNVQDFYRTRTSQI